MGHTVALKEQRTGTNVLQLLWFQGAQVCAPKRQHLAAFQCLACSSFWPQLYALRRHWATAQGLPLKQGL